MTEFHRRAAPRLGVAAGLAVPAAALPVAATSSGSQAPGFQRVRMGEAGDIDTVLLIHLHPDHIGGLIADGRAAFRNAEIEVSAASLAYWTSGTEAVRAPHYAQIWFAVVVTLVRLYDDRLSAFTGEAAAAPAVMADPLPRHTPDHSGFVLESGGGRLFFWGDVSDFLALQLADPRATLVSDADKATGERAHRRAFEMAASERLRIAGSHVPFPGFGFLGREGGGLRFVADRRDHTL